MKTLTEFATKVKDASKVGFSGRILTIAVNGILPDYQGRIFDDSLNTAGVKLPNPPYSTRPLTVEVSQLPRKAGVISKDGKKAFFIGGYAELKKAVGRKPLELTGNLRRDVTSPVVTAKDDVITISIKREENVEKIFDLETKYGKIFNLNENEKENLESVFVDELVKTLFPR